MQQWLAGRGLGWDDCGVTFYSDSTNDLPLLERATIPWPPIPVLPCASHRAAARLAHPGSVPDIHMIKTFIDKLLGKQRPRAASGPP